MKLFIRSIVFVVCFLSAGFLIAQDNTDYKAEKIQELIDIIGSKEQFENFINSGLNTILMKYKNNLTQEDIRILKEESVTMIHTFLENDLANIYAKYLNLNEVEDLIEFYNSETGKRYRQMQPLISSEIQSTLMAKYMADFQQTLTERLKSKNN